MSFYGMTLQEIHSLPIYTFWELNKNISRIQAVQDNRMFALLQNCISGNPREYLASLQKEQGNIVDVEEEREALDIQAFQQLKAKTRG